MDYEYVLGAARAAKAGGLQAFHVVTSVGSNAASRMLYPKTKGRTEEGLKELSLARLSIYRPGVLLCNRAEKRLLDQAGRFFLAPLAAVAPTAMTVPTKVVGRAMVVNSVLGGVEGGTETLENAAIHAMAKKDL